MNRLIGDITPTSSLLRLSKVLINFTCHFVLPFGCSEVFGSEN